MPKDKKPGPRRKKLTIVFDDKTRKEYLGGFHKRKQERRVKAQNDIAKKLKQKVRDERNKKRKATKEKTEDILAGVYGVDKLINGQDEVKENATEKVEFENHEVFVNTDMNFGDSGFVLSTNNATNGDIQEEKNADEEEKSSSRQQERQVKGKSKRQPSTSPYNKKKKEDGKQY